MCVSLVCVLVLFRASVCAFRVSELLVVRLSFVVKLFLLRCVSCEIPKFSCRVLKSNFRVVFWSRFSNSRSRILKSILEFVFFVSLLYSISRISIFDSSFEFKCLDFSRRICRRNFRSLVLFDFSNLDFRVELSSKFSFRCSIRLLEFRFESFVALFDFSKSIVKFDFSNFEFSIQVPWISNSSWSIRLLELSSKVSLLYSTSRISICDFDSKVSLI